MGLRTRTGWLLLAGFSAAYFVATGLLAAHKPLWFDELVTYHVARLRTPSAVWDALRRGSDLMPPLYFLVTGAALTVFGDNPVAARLPAALGFWVMSLSVLAFVRRRCAPASAWVALLFPLTTSAYAYAYEARPYGFVLGCCGVALLCWQAAAEGRRRRLALAGLTLSLAAAVASHYYAVLLLLPLGLGELVRSRARRQVDLPLWAALGLSLTPLALCWPLIRRGMQSVKQWFFSAGTWSMVPGFYVWLLGLSLFPLAVLVLWGLFAARAELPAAAGTTEGVAARSFPAYEIAAVVALAALPLFGVTLAIYVVGGYTHRYALPAVIGFAVLLATALDRLGRPRRVLTGTLAAVMVGWFVLQVVQESRKTPESVAVQEEIDGLLGPGSAGDHLPVVVGDLTAYLVWAQYSPPPLAARLTWVTDDANLLELVRPIQSVAALHPEDYATFAATHKQFLLLSKSGADPDWLLRDLKDRGAHVAVKAQGSHVTVLRVDCDPSDSRPQP